jgi:membrane protease YdiL (CAAX protease family)
MVKSVISWKSRLRIAVLFTIVIWILILLLPRLLSLAGMPKPDDSSFAEQIQDNPAALISILLKVWTTVAFGEEVLGRVFLIDRFEAIFKGIPWNTQLSVILASILFGLAHAYQGLSGIILTATIGLIVSILYLYQKRSIWTNVVVHGMVDTVAMVLLFFGVKFV